MKKQRWRKTKVMKCSWCSNKIDTSKVYGVDDWSYQNKIVYWCHDCMNHDY